MKVFRIFTLIMISLCTYANAEWTTVAESKDRSATFIDKTSVRKHGGFSEMWSVIVYLDPREVNGKKIMSLKELDEFDCKEKRFRPVTLIAYSGKLATGNIVSADFEVGEWSTLPAKSIGEIQRTYACD